MRSEAVMVWTREPLWEWLEEVRFWVYFRSRAKRIDDVVRDKERSQDDLRILTCLIEKETWHGWVPKKCQVGIIDYDLTCIET